MDTVTALEKLATYPFLIVSWVDDAGYPVNVAIDASVAPAEGTVRFAAPAGFDVPADRPVSLTGSHIRPQPGYGYDERRHVTAWGDATISADRQIAFVPTRAWGWDEQETPFFEYSERSVAQSRRYFDAISAERGTPVRPHLSRGLLTLRATRMPFLTATFVPVLLGLAVAARQGYFDWPTALITIVAASFVHLGLNVVNDIFDTIQGADDANVTPTQFSGGSRVLQYGLVTLRGMGAVAIGCYAVAFVLGLVLLALRPSAALVVIAALGFFISVAYTMPPFKLVYRGLGEIATAIGFGPVMLLGAYVVQTRGVLTWEAFLASIPVAMLVMLILYVNEVPDRRGDAHAGKRTLPVRWPKSWVIVGYDAAAAVAFLAVVVGVVAGLLPATTLVALVAIPLAARVHEGLNRYYEQPYGLMAFMGTNVKLHLAVGALLIAGYAVAIAAQQLIGAHLLLR